MKCIGKEDRQIMTNLSELEEIITYKFKDNQLLKEALTHRSYSAEHSLDYDNQRLEFLGDAVIQLVVTEYLYNRYPKKREGHLTKMRSVFTQQAALANLARQIKLGKFIFLGKGELKAGGNSRDSTLSDAFEALTGAICLDGKLSSAREFLTPLLNAFSSEPAKLLSILNPKGLLQEYTQQQWGIKPEYIVEKIKGPDHNRIYSVAVYLDGKIAGRGSAQSRKSAEINAASSALELIKKNSVTDN